MSRRFVPCWGMIVATFVVQPVMGPPSFLTAAFCGLWSFGAFTGFGAFPVRLERNPSDRRPAHRLGKSFLRMLAFVTNLVPGVLGDCGIFPGWVLAQSLPGARVSTLEEKREKQH